MPEKIELLAPVGGEEALRAAVENGADAVYLGGKLFSARAFAQNFASEELVHGVKYAHLRGVKVYAAVNTILDNSEMEQLPDYLAFLNSINIDAIIVQDLGVALAVKTLLPEMSMFASTQMTVHNSAGARFLEKIGFDRAILAREVSLENIRLISQATRVPLEIFIHGALCVSYSGQCLMSSMIGGRSGNRGRCAQPCRMNYTLVKDGAEVKEGHLLSPRDLNLIEHLPLIAEAGIVSVKIEGRMKRPEYVATVVRHYREAIDKYYSDPQKYQVSDKTHKELAQIFNRDFTAGYFLEKPGPELMGYQRPNNRGLKLGRVKSFDQYTREVVVSLEDGLRVGDGYEIWVTKGGRVGGEIRSLRQNSRSVENAENGDVSFFLPEGTPSVGDRVFKTMDIELMEQTRETFQDIHGTRRIPLKFSFQANIGQPLILTAGDDLGHQVMVKSSYIAEKAQKHPLTDDTLQKQLNRLGNTVFSLECLQTNVEDGLMAPVSELNNMRREAVEKIEELRLSAWAKPQFEPAYFEKVSARFLNSLPEPRESQGPVRLAVTVGDMDSLRAALESGADLVYFGGDRLRNKKGIGMSEYAEAVALCRTKGTKSYLALPRIYSEDSANRIAKMIESGREAGVDGFLAGNPALLQLAFELGLKGIRCDYTLNIFNDYSIKVFRDWEAESVTLSPELTCEQIGRLRHRGNLDLECLVHGSLPLMITEHCAIGNILGKGHLSRGCTIPCSKGNYGLKDRMNLIFPLVSDENCRMQAYNPKTLAMINKLPDLLENGVRTLRIEARKEEAYWVKRVTAAYREEINRYITMGSRYTPLEETRESLLKLAPAGFTTGHYYRGIE